MADEKCKTGAPCVVVIQVGGGLPKSKEIRICCGDAQTCTTSEDEPSSGKDDSPCCAGSGE